VAALLVFPAALVLHAAAVEEGGGQKPAEEPAAERAPAAEGAAELSPGVILTRARSALSGCGAVEAVIEMEVNYPAHYSSRIELLASPTGNERAEILTRVRENTTSTLEVIRDGVLWTEQSTPTGPLVTKIDLREVKERLASEGSRFAPLPALGTNALFDLAGISKLVDFDEAAEVELEGEPVYRVAGKLAEAFRGEGSKLPAGARRWYERVRIFVGAEDFLLRRVELGRGDPGPLCSLDFTELDPCGELPEGAFDYEPPEGAQVVDRTDWAVLQLSGE